MLRERVQVLPEPRFEGGARVVVVMQVHLDLANRGATERPEPVQEVRRVLLAGEEEAMARRRRDPRRDARTEIEAFAAKYLPAVPFVIEYVDDIPPTAAGKRRAVVVERPPAATPTNSAA